MGYPTFLDLYRSDLQSVYALWLVPALFLSYLLLTSAGRAAASDADPDLRFVHRYCLAFAVETILDPLATGPLTRWLGAGDTWVGTAILLLFVLLGDFRVFLLVFRLARPAGRTAGALVDAARWMLIVPAVALAVESGLRAAFPDLPAQSIWLVYELAFLAMALWLRARGIPGWAPPGPRRRALAAIATYVTAYYALWAAADVLILVLGLDAGWALRIVPNQLYYAFYLPFVWSQLTGER